MLSLECNEFGLLIDQSAALRGAGRFLDAINLIEKKLSEMTEDCLQNAYLEIIYAAQEGQFSEKAIEYAKKLRDIDPNIPTVKKILNDQ